MMVSSFLLAVFLAFIGTVSCAFQFQCSARTEYKLSSLEADARKVLDKTPQIWECYRKTESDYMYSVIYQICIINLHLPVEYASSIALWRRKEFDSNQSFKESLEKLGADKCNESTNYQPFKSIVKGGIFEEDGSMTTYIIIGVIIVAIGIIIGVIIYKRNQDKESGSVDVQPYAAPANGAYPPMSQNPGPYPYQYPQTMTPVASPYVASPGYYQGPR
jgi:hypothetical protein